MRVGDEAGADSEQREGFDLQVGRVCDDVGLVERDVRVVLLVYVKVLHQTLSEKVVKGPGIYVTGETLACFGYSTFFALHLRYLTQADLNQTTLGYRVKSSPGGTKNGHHVGRKISFFLFHFLIDLYV